MAGYIGSKAVTLSTTAADVAGNAVIDGDLTVKGTTVTIDSAAVQEIRLGDNDKMTFGDATGGDLQIYHDSANNKSYIEESGAGNLVIRGSDIDILAGNGEAGVNVAQDGAVTLYYDNNAKLATDATGIAVTGRITTDAITEDTSGNVGIGTSTPSNNHANANNLVVGNGTAGGIANYVGTGLGWYAFSRDNANNSDAYDGGISYDGSRNLMFHTNAGTERMRIDSSGNVGINESSPDTKLHVSNNASQTPIATIENTAHHEATIRFKSAHSAASDFRVGASISASNNFEIYSVDAATARLAINSGGDVAIGGTSTSAWNGAQGRKFIVSGPNNTIVSLQSSTTSANQGAILEGYATSVTSGSPALGSVAFLRTNTSNTALSSATAFYTNNAGSIDERMRITSSGGVAIGATDLTRHGQTTKTLIYNSSGTAAHAALHCSRNGTGTEFQVAFSNAYGVRGTITTTASAVAYNTTSDYRLKENVTDVTDGITRLKQLAPKRFNFIVDPDKTVDGFIAHEAQSVVPEAVTGTHDGMRDEEYEVTAALGEVYTPAASATYDDDGNKLTEVTDEVIHSTDVAEPETLEDGQFWRETTAAVMGTRSVPDYQGIDQSKLVPLLTAALQEAVAKIETLETEMTSVKARLDALEGN